MAELIRFGVSLDRELLNKFDNLIKEKGYTNRSEAFRDLIREELVKKEWNDNDEVAGAITLMYDHHKRDLLSNVTDVQHDYQHIIISTQHIHLDHHNCLEIIAVKGNAKEVQKLHALLRSVKGIMHGTLNMTSTGSKLR